MRAAHDLFPDSHATRGNVDVTLIVNGRDTTRAATGASRDPYVA